MQLGKLVLGDPLFERVADVGKSAAAYVKAEARYTNAFLGEITQSIVSVIIFAGIAWSCFMALLIGGVVAIAVVGLSRYPEINFSLILSALGLILLLGLGVVIAIQTWCTRRVKKLLDEYRSHWSY